MDLGLMRRIQSPLISYFYLSLNLISWAQLMPRKQEHTHLVEAGRIDVFDECMEVKRAT